MTSKLTFAALAAVSLLCACGGGGSGGSSSGGGAKNSISLDRSRLDLATQSAASPAESAEVVVTFKGAGVLVGTLPGTTAPDWLFVSAPTTVSSTSVSIRITFVPSSSQPRRYTTTLRFATGDANGANVVFRDLEVTGTIDHTLLESKAFFSYTRGATITPSASADVQTANAMWAATSDVPWLSVTPAAGTGNATLTIATAPNALAEGDYSGTITVRDTLTNRTKTLAVRLGVDPRRLELNREGIALSSTPGRSRLTSGARIVDTAGLAGHWALIDDAPWLSASATTGAGSADVMFTADPTGLGEGTHYATVTVSPNAEPGLTNSVSLRVGFYVDRTTPVQAAHPVPGERPFFVVADPIRPLAYGFAVQQPNSILQVWNVYTGALVHSQIIPNSAVLHAGITPDGSRLLAVSGSSSIYPIALSDGPPVVGAKWADPPPGSPILGENLSVSRLNGVPIVAWPPNYILSANDGSVLAQLSGLEPIIASFPASVALSPNGRRLFLVNHYQGNHEVAYAMLGNSGGGYRAVVTRAFSEPYGGVYGLFDRDGEHVISVSGGEMRRYTFGSVTPETIVPGGANRFVDHPDGGGYQVNFLEWKHYDRTLNFLGAVQTGPGLSDNIWAISADGQRMLRDGSYYPAWAAFTDVSF